MAIETAFSVHVTTQSPRKPHRDASRRQSDTSVLFFLSNTTVCVCVYYCHLATNIILQPRAFQPPFNTCNANLFVVGPSLRKTIAWRSPFDHANFHGHPKSRFPPPAVCKKPLQTAEVVPLPQSPSPRPHIVRHRQAPLGARVRRILMTNREPKHGEFDGAVSVAVDVAVAVIVGGVGLCVGVGVGVVIVTSSQESYNKAFTLSYIGEHKGFRELRNCLMYSTLPVRFTTTPWRGTSSSSSSRETPRAAVCTIPAKLLKTPFASEEGATSFWTTFKRDIEDFHLRSWNNERGTIVSSCFCTRVLVDSMPLRSAI